MQRLLVKHKSPLLFVLVVMVLFFESKIAFAHSPHDIVEALAISPNYDQDKIVFVADPTNDLLKSTNGGFSWEQVVNGLDLLGQITSIVISPNFQHDQTLFISARGDGVYRSQDRGGSWVKVNDGLDDLRISLLAISTNYPADKVMLATGNQGDLYRTDNEGHSWHQVLNTRTQITAIAFFADDEKNSVLMGDQQSNLYLSIDGGRNWQRKYRLSGAGAITSIAISPNVADDGTVFIGTEDKGVFKSVDWGNSFVAVNDGISDYKKTIFGHKELPKSIRSIAISPGYETDSTVFASTWSEAVFQSNDGGNYWQLYSQGLTTDSQANTEQYKSPHFRGLQVSSTFAKDKTIFLAGFDGLFKSIDGGHVWMAMQTLSPERISGLSVSSGSKEHPTIAIATAGGGIYTTEDQGQTWLVHNKALNRADPMDIAISPNYHSDQTILFTSETDFGISKDNGQNWSITGFDSQENRIRSLARSAFYRLGLPIPTQLKSIKPKPDIIVFSPNYASDKTIFFGTRNDGVYQSVNGGQSWLAIWKGKKISSLVISPDFSSDKTLFVDDRDSGVYKTIDSGKTWQHINNGLAFTKNTSPATLSTDLTRQDIKLVISPNYEIDQTAFAGSVEDLFKTIDGGASWQKLEVLPDEKHSFIIAMAVSPDYKNDQTIIVSIKGKGLFKSEDGGLNFVEIGSDLIYNNYSLKWIKPSSSYPIDQTIYGASYQEIFLSTDGGHSWKMLPRLIRYEDNYDGLYYVGKWDVLKDGASSISCITQSSLVHNQAVLYFVGTGVAWIGPRSSDHGIARVYIDNDLKAEIDQFSETSESMVTLYSITGLAPSLHSVMIEITDTKNPASTGYKTAIDAFDVVL